MDEAKARAVAGWLIDGARSAMDSGAVLGELCGRLVEGGLPLARVGVFVRTLHPQLMGRSFVWQPGAEVRTNLAPADFALSAEYLESPIARVYHTRQALRRHLADPQCPMDFSILTQFRAEGMTDYFATPLFFTDGAVHGATWTTRRPGGFTAADIAAIETILAPLGAGRGGARAAPHRRQSARHLCRPSRRRAHPRRQDPSRRHRADPGRHLALRHARLHRAGGSHGAAKA